MATAAPAPAPSLDSACDQLIQYRQRPLLVMYYPETSYMTEPDVRDAYDELRRGGCTKEAPIPELDLLIHTNGGDPLAAYRIAQTIRKMANGLAVLVPERAYSAGTLLSFAGDSVRLGDGAGLSPIDITLNESHSDEGVQLAAIDSFMEFAQKARKQIEELFQKLDCKRAKSCVDSDLLVQMVQQVGALTVGRYYRERLITGHYAEILLDNYMLNGISNGTDRRNDVIRKFLLSAPSHDFHLDYRLCALWHLVVEEMPTQESDLAGNVIGTLGVFTGNGSICLRLNNRMRMPFIRFYPFTLPSGGGPNASAA